MALGSAMDGESAENVIFQTTSLPNSSGNVRKMPPKLPVAIHDVESTEYHGYCSMSSKLVRPNPWNFRIGRPFLSTRYGMHLSKCRRRSGPDLPTVPPRA